jgi:bacterioferritin (cytochrome b1)
MLEGILAVEEEHAEELSSMLKRLGGGKQARAPSRPAANG